MKRPWQSKTVWANLVLAALAFVPGFDQFVSDHPSTTALVISVVGIILRYVSRDAIFAIALLLPLIISCAGADIVVPKDDSLPPAKGNYDNLIMKTDQYPDWSLGQTGVSLEYGEDLRNHTVTIFSPLGGVLFVYGYECGADRNYVLKQGEIKTFTLDEIVPAQVDFCTISFRMDWDDIPKVELPFEGQTGKLYVRIRDAGDTMSEASWLPGPVERFTGIAWGQFRALANPSSPVNPVQLDQTSEPIRLTITSSQPTEKGVYQLWSEAKKIGIKSTPFSGRQVQIERSQIVGSSTVQSYSLAGFLLGNDGLRDDIWVGVNVFDNRVKRLGGSVTFTDTEVCYETESRVALSILEGNDKPQNAHEGCFPKPPGKAVMAFFTHNGTCAIARLNGEEYEWIQ